MVIQYTSNGLSTDLVVHQLVQLSSYTCIDSFPKSLSAVQSVIRHFNATETSSTHAQLLMSSINRLGKSQQWSMQSAGSLELSETGGRGGGGGGGGAKG